MAESGTGSPEATTGADTGFNTNLGIANPGSPADEMGTTVMPSSGGVGEADPMAHDALSGDEQGRDLGIVDEGSQVPAGEQLRQRLTSDIDPQHSNVSGPTNFEEGRNQ